VWVRPDPENASRVMTALSRFGAPTDHLGIAAGDFSRPNSAKPSVSAHQGLPDSTTDSTTFRLVDVPCGRSRSRIPKAGVRGWSGDGRTDTTETSPS
jgi:hypothetical protein